MNNIESIIKEIKNNIIKNSPDTLFQLYGYNGLSLIELHSRGSFRTDREKEQVSASLRSQIQMERPEFVISACIGLTQPITFKKRKKDKREVLIVCIENSEGLYHIENFYINRSGKKIQGLSPAWSYDNATIKKESFSIAGVLCGWYQSLEEIYEYIEEGNRKAQSMSFN